MGRVVAVRGRALSPETAARAERLPGPLCQNRDDRCRPVPMPEPPVSSRSFRPRWLPRFSPWLLVPAAILLGLLLFLLVWLSQRPSPDADGTAVLPAVTVGQDTQGPQLPAPQLPDLVDGTFPEEREGGVFTLPDAPPEPPRMTAGEAAPAAGSEPDPGLAGTASAVTDSQPEALHSPPPTYPARALRRGASGTVLVRALVDTDGRPRQIEVVRESPHRALDQAAVRAVRGWRFQPAMRDGQPVAQTVDIPFEFSP